MPSKADALFWWRFFKYATKFDTVLDLGCGEGTKLSLTGAKQRVGVDHQESRILRAKTINPDATYVLADALTTAIAQSTKSFELVLLLAILEHMDKSKGLELLVEAQRVASKRVFVWLSEHTGGPDQRHKSSYSANEIRMLGYEVEVLKDCYEDEYEPGRRNDALCCVADPAMRRFIWFVGDSGTGKRMAASGAIDNKTNVVRKMLGLRENAIWLHSADFSDLLARLEETTADDVLIVGQWNALPLTDVASKFSGDLIRIWKSRKLQARHLVVQMTCEPEETARRCSARGTTEWTEFPVEAVIEHRQSLTSALVLVKAAGIPTVTLDTTGEKYKLV
jgi:hypothetical protein